MAKKVGIALGSGSARGWSHIGVIRSLLEAGIPIDITCGASIGALVAGSYAAGFLDPLDRWVRKLSWSHIIGFMDVMIPRSGLVEGEKISGYLRGVLSDPMIEDLPVPFCRRRDRSQDGQGGLDPRGIAHRRRPGEHIAPRHFHPLRAGTASGWWTGGW